MGTIAGVMAFMSSAARAIDDAFSGGEVTAAPAEPGRDDASSEGTQGDLGTRSNPYPLGTIVSNQDREVAINSVDLDASAEVAPRTLTTTSPTRATPLRW